MIEVSEERIMRNDDIKNDLMHYWLSGSDTKGTILDQISTDIYENDQLKHWGILGMKWGIRRFQNEDGTLTPEGRERYLKSGSGRKDYFNDNWKLATSIAEQHIKTDPKYTKFLKKTYREFDKDTGEPIDYYTLIWNEADNFLSDKYEKLVQDELEKFTYYSKTK